MVTNHLEPQTTIYKRLFQLDDSQSLHRKWCLGFQAPTNWDDPPSTGAMNLANPMFFWLFFNQMSHEKNPGWLFYMEDYTTQLYRDYNKPL